MSFSRFSRFAAATSNRLGGIRGAHLRGLGALGLLLAFVGSVALVSPQVASADTKAASHVVPAIRPHDAPGFPGTSTTAPLNECPQIGFDASCGILIVISNNGEQVLQDTNNSAAGYTNPNPGSEVPYDADDDTLVGIVNESSKPVYAVQLSGESSGTPLFGFDGDGICTYGTGGSNAQGSASTGSGGSYVGGAGQPPRATRATSTALPHSFWGYRVLVDPTPSAATTRAPTTRSRTSAPTWTPVTSTSPTV